MKIIKLTCPNCGAPLEFDQKHPIHFCSHCGTPLLFDDESKTININYREEKHVYDEARIEEAKKERASDKQSTVLALVLLGVGVFLAILATIIGA